MLDLSKYLCKHCGAKVGFGCEEKTTYCVGCGKEITRPVDTMPTYTFNARIAQLKAMHELISNANDESIYMSWIYLMPDGATEEDFEYIALDDDLYNECWDLFAELVKRKGNRW